MFEYADVPFGITDELAFVEQTVFFDRVGEPDGVTGSDVVFRDSRLKHHVMQFSDFFDRIDLFGTNFGTLHTFDTVPDSLGFFVDDVQTLYRSIVADIGTETVCGGKCRRPDVLFVDLERWARIVARAALDAVIGFEKLFGIVGADKVFGDRMLVDFSFEIRFDLGVFVPEIFFVDDEIFECPFRTERLDDEFEVELPGGRRRYAIVDIRYGSPATGDGAGARTPGRS